MLTIALVSLTLFQAAPQKRGLVSKSAAASPGYVLIAPLRSPSTYLLDRDGRIAHEWQSDAPPGQAVYLLDDGHLLRTENVPNPVFHAGGAGGRVRELDWDGKLVWEYVCSDETRLLHHDIEPLPNGNVLMIAWEHRTIAQGAAAGRDAKTDVWPDMVLEVVPERPSGGKIVWEWHAWDHLVQDRDPTKPDFGEVAAHPERLDVNAGARAAAAPTEEERREMKRLRALGYIGDDDPTGDGPGGQLTGAADWLHTNSIAYHPELDLILLSSRELSEILVIDHSTTTEEARGTTGGRWGHGGDLLFRWGNPRMHGVGAASDQQLFHQHDAQWIAPGLPGAGHVLVFNNGDRVRDFSTVDELTLDLTPETLKHGFALEGGVTVTLVRSLRTADMFSSHISGAQRLPNGNTLVCVGESGRVVELSPTDEVVWDFLNPFGGDEREQRGPPGGAAPRDGAPSLRRDPLGSGGPVGPGSRGDPRALFRATHVAADSPAVSRLAAPTDK